MQTKITKAIKAIAAAAQCEVANTGWGNLPHMYITKQDSFEVLVECHLEFQREYFRIHVLKVNGSSVLGKSRSIDYVQASMITTFLDLIKHALPETVAVDNVVN
jgi:hypothetical protein